MSNADAGVLTGEVPVLLPPERTVIEVPETVRAAAEVVEGRRRLVRRGYQVALNDFVFVEGIERLVELASIVRIDILLVPGEELPQMVSRLRDYGVKLLAEKVETDEQLHHCCSLGFDLFQGYLLSRPRLDVGRTLDSSSLARLQLAARLLDRELDLAEIERIVRAEPAMAYQLLQLSGVGADEELRAAVLAGDGPVGRLLADVMDHLLGHSDAARRSAASRERLDAAGMAALTWAVEVARGAAGSEAIGA